jgi:hypothetical protein
LSARAAWAASLALALLASASCTKILGIDYKFESAGAGGGTTSSTTTTTSGTGGGGKCGSYVWDQEASCQTCMEKVCCSELRACDTGTPCAELADCAHKCMPADDMCLGACLATDTSKHASGGADAYYALLSCFGSNCQGAADCSFPICNSTFTWSIRGCADCLSADMACCAAFTACANDGVCTACIENPANQGCSGNMNYITTNNCVSTTCGLSCANSICGSPVFGYTSPRCNYCLSQMTGGCCAPFDACVMDTMSVCYNCMESAAATGCGSDMNYQAYSACYSANCQVECSGF